MWSDPIENALANAATLLDAILSAGKVPTHDSWERALSSVQDARRAREFEKANGRLVEPEDRY